MPPRVPATQIHNHVARLLEGHIYKAPPVWYPVVCGVPPGPSLLRGSLPFNFRETVKTEKSGDKEDPNSNNVNNYFGRDHSFQSSSRRYSSKRLRTRRTRPQQIVYPEDRLRRIFYRDHPYELLRPQSLMETGSPSRQWDKLMEKGQHPSEVTGESVIQYQLHLMTNEGMTELQAYVTACNEFYAIRAQEEVEQRIAEEQAIAFGAVRPKSEVEKAMWKEHKEIRKGLKSLKMI